MKKRKWILRPSDITHIDCKSLNISKLAAIALTSKGYVSTIKIREFLGQKNTELSDPFLLKDMEKAVSIIKETIENDEKIVIYGDYDVDGVTSTSILTDYFRSKGANTEFYIPNRVGEGYGLNKEAMQSIKNGGASLIITVDCGITAVEEVAFAKEIGLKVIVTDHHSCKDIVPKADALVNPKQVDCNYPYKNLAGVGVAFKLICAYEGDTPKMLEKYSDIVAIGTIADVMPLTKENRTIVSHGIEKLKRTENIGIYSLMEESGIKDISSGVISFKIAPRLNASGRMGHAKEAARLLLSKDENFAKECAAELCAKNADRQREEAEILNEVIKKIEQEVDFANDKIIVVWGENWHHGVVGIVSSRIIEKYYLPVIIISIENGVAKGSGRSIKGFNLFDALVTQDKLLLKYGGHEMAAGMTLEMQNIKELKKNLLEVANERITDDMLLSKIYIDGSIEFSDITVGEIDGLSVLEPYGPANAQPIFKTSNVEIIDIVELSEGKHLKLTLQSNGIKRTALMFSVTRDEFSFNVCDEIDICYTLGLNEFRDNITPQLYIKDVKPSKKVCLNEQKQVEIYNKFIAFEKMTEAEILMLKPSRKDFEIAFKNLKKMTNIFDLFDFARKIKINPGKMLICLECFKQSGIISYENKDNLIKVEINKVTGKVVLEQTEIYKRLKEGEIYG